MRWASRTRANLFAGKIVPSLRLRTHMAFFHVHFQKMRENEFIITREVIPDNHTKHSENTNKYNVYANEIIPYKYIVPPGLSSGTYF